VYDEGGKKRERVQIVGKPLHAREEGRRCEKDPICKKKTRHEVVTVEGKRCRIVGDNG